MNKLKLLAISSVIGTALVYIYTFILAYLNQNKNIIFAINNYNEANMEMFIFVPIVLFSCIYLIIDYIKSEDKDEN